MALHNPFANPEIAAGYEAWTRLLVAWLTTREGANERKTATTISAGWLDPT